MKDESLYNFDQVYEWRVMDDIKRGRTIFALDKLNCRVINLAETNFKDVLDIINCKTDRWYLYSVELKGYEETEVQEVKF